MVTRAAGNVAPAPTMGVMGAIQRIGNWLGLTRAPAGSMPAGLAPPARTVWELTERRAIAVPAVYRAVQVLTTAAKQLSLDVRRGQTPVDRVPSIIRRPSVALRMDDWLAQLVLDLATDGNAYMHKVTQGSEVLDLPILPAAEVTIAQDFRTGAVTYHHNRTEYRPDEIIHLSMVRKAGWLKGIGPLEAARRGLQFSSGATDYAANWFDGSGQPTGALYSDQTLNREQAELYRNTWNGLDQAGNPIDQTSNPSGIRVLGRGLKYEPILLKPSDVLWLEAQDFTITDIARLYGIPATLMHIGVDGSSTTYTNVTQEWLAFLRWTLMGYLRPIEQALSEITARGLEVRFNLETLLRGDTLSRYAAHEIAIRSGWLDVEEVRAIEGLPPRTTTAALEDHNVE